MYRRRNSPGVPTPVGNTLGKRISSTRMNTMFGCLSVFLAAPAACSRIPRSASRPPATTAPLFFRKSRRSMLAPLARRSTRRLELGLGVAILGGPKYPHVHERGPRPVGNGRARGDSRRRSTNELRSQVGPRAPTGPPAPTEHVPHERHEE